LVRPGIASRNHLHGIFLDGCRSTTLDGVQALFNTEFGIVAAGVNDSETSINFFAQANTLGGLSLRSGTSRLQVNGFNIAGLTGLVLDGADATLNTINMVASGCTGDGVRVLSARSNELTLAVGNCTNHGVFVSGGSHNHFTLTVSNNMLDGARFTDGAATNVIVGTVVSNRTGLVLAGGASENLVQDFRANANRQHGIWLTGTGTRYNRVLGARSGLSILTVPTNEPPGNALDGIRIANGTNNVILGALAALGDPARVQPAGIIIEDNAAGTIIGGATQPCTSSGNLAGILIRNGATRTDLSGSFMHHNSGPGIVCTGGASDTDIIDNFISGNSIGVLVDGFSTFRNAIVANRITGNSGKGIALLGFSNDGIEAPVITDITSQSVMGTSSAPDGSSIEVFTDPDDEGEFGIGWGYVRHGWFSATLVSPIKVTDVGFRFNLHATVTDTKGNTSEFGDYIASGNASGEVQIAFASTRDGNSEIYLTDGSSAPPTRLTSDPSDDHNPALSQDGARLAFVSTRAGNAEIFTLPLSNAASVVRLTSHAAADYDPAWSPDGSNIVFVSERDGNAEIYRMHADGSALQRLTSASGSDRWPAFSPDGTKIVFASTRNGTYDLFLMDTNGSNVTTLVTGSSADTRPAWSPDGELIAFVSDRDGNDEIYTVKPDGTSLTRLTDAPSSDSEPAWLHTGQMLIFSSNREEGFELYSMPRAGGPAVRLTVSTGDNAHPSAARR